MALFQKIINIGITKKLTHIEIRLLKMANIINIIFIVISIIATILITNLDHTGFKSYIRFIILILFCIFNITLNYFHKYLPFKALTVFAPFLSLCIFPIFNQFIHPGLFLWFPYGIMVFGATSLFIFSFEQEKKILHFILLFFAAASLFYDKIFLYAVPNNLDLSFIYVDNYLYYQASKTILLFFLYSALYFAKITTYKSRRELADLNNQLDQKNIQLNNLNQNLENIVIKRTEQLKLQNKRIKELTHTNSHKIRAYVARIVGLINLSDGNLLPEEEKHFCYTQIQKAALELDEETKEVSKKLSEEY